MHWKAAVAKEEYEEERKGGRISAFPFYTAQHRLSYHPVLVSSPVI